MGLDRISTEWYVRRRKTVSASGPAFPGGEKAELCISIMAVSGRVRAVRRRAARQFETGRTTACRIMQELREAPDKGCGQGSLYDVREDVVEIIARVGEIGWTTLREDTIEPRSTSRAAGK